MIWMTCTHAHIICILRIEMPAIRFEQNYNYHSLRAIIYTISINVDLNFVFPRTHIPQTPVYCYVRRRITKTTAALWP